ncbi:uncharacterized protein (TIGR04141 family) [Bradyrhizobium sp. CIR18]|nr:uncharacterized protein (TIGR04141 family) [Bradyrhizobium sp. CIR18]
MTGRSRVPLLGKLISGRDSLSIAVKIDRSEICAFLPACLQRYESNEYKTDFDWIDQIRDIRDPTQRDQLNENLLERLKNGDLDRVWMAPPIVVDWVDIQGFKYSKAKSSDLKNDLDIQDFLSSLNTVDLTIGVLKSRLIYAISSKADSEIDRWSAYNCLYAETVIGERVFILNQGKWYEVAGDFSKLVIQDYNAIPESQIPLPHYAHASEGEYNEYVPSVVGNACCMDRKLVSYGGAHSTIEFCDVLTDTKQLVHIKRYGGSSHLSHLFNQGVVSGELFVSDGKFRKSVNEKLPAAYKWANTDEAPDPREWEIIFAIISKSNNALDIPFFSKVALRNAQRRLQSYGYKVRKKKIQIVP